MSQIMCCFLPELWGLHMGATTSTLLTKTQKTKIIVGPLNKKNLCNITLGRVENLGVPKTDPVRFKWGSRRGTF